MKRTSAPSDGNCLRSANSVTSSARDRRGYELIARQADAPVVPVWLDQLWGSIFSFYGGKFFKKIPRQIPYPVCVAFGKPLSPDEADIGTVRRELLALGEFCYQQRPRSARLRADCAAGGRAGRAGVAGSIVGLDLFVLRRQVFQKNSAADSVSGLRRVWQTAQPG